VLALGATWTVFTVGWHDLSAGFGLFALLSALGVSLARELESEAELRRTSARPDLVLVVVRRRAELLDEIVRHRDGTRQS
jgi:hypothetical protein